MREASVIYEPGTRVKKLTDKPFRKPYIEEQEIHDNVVPMNIPHDNNFYSI